MVYRPSEAERDVALEFRGAPDPPYTPALQRMLDYFRGMQYSIDGRLVLACTVPYKEWKLCRLTGQRGRATIILEDQVFTDQREAEWAVFKLRWKELIGTDLE